MSSERTSLINARPPGLVDVLDRILDKGLVIAGDIKISLANVELLTLQIRLLVCSIDKAEQIGLNWWRYDRNLTTGDRMEVTGGRGGSEEPPQRPEKRAAPVTRRGSHPGSGRGSGAGAKKPRRRT